MNNNIKLLAPVAEPVQQPTFPLVNFRFESQVVIVNIALGPMTSIIQIIPASDFDQVCAQHQRTQREARRAEALAAEVLRTKSRQ